MQLLFCLFYGILNGQTTVTYTSSEEIIANPERGFQKYSITDNSYNTKTAYSNLSQTTLTGWRTGTDKVTVIFRYFLLSSFLNTDISTIYLQNIQKDFDIIRASGLKCIVRFSYSDSQSSSAQQPTKSQILRHITQLTTLLNTNKDVIFSIQAGFIGTWGEWYYTNSDEFGTEDAISATQWANRKEIIEEMLVATPVEIPLQVRYTEIKKTMYGIVSLSPETAYKNSANARIGFYNDAFLNKWGDMGTYSVNSSSENPVGTADYIYLSNETQYTPMTGETNGLNSPRTGGANAVIEMNATNWTTLNRDYYTQNFNNWISSGHYPEIVKRLGYRLVLEQCEFNFINNALNINLTLKNQGYARIFKLRNAFIMLKNTTTGQTYSFILNSDPRTWADLVEINQSFELSNLPAGNYTCNLHMPDSDNNLSKRPEYCIRFANENVWNEVDGTNKLNFSFQLPLTSKVIIPEDDAAYSEMPFSVFETTQSGMLKIKISQQDVLHGDLSVLDLSGKVIRKINPVDNTFSSGILILNVSDLYKGYYILKMGKMKVGFWR